MVINNLSSKDWTVINLIEHFMVSLTFLTQDREWLCSLLVQPAYMVLWCGPYILTDCVFSSLYPLISAATSVIKQCCLYATPSRSLVCYKKMQCNINTAFQLFSLLHCHIDLSNNLIIKHHPVLLVFASFKTLRTNQQL